MLGEQLLEKITSLLKGTYYIYPGSFRQDKNLFFFIAKDDRKKYLGVAGNLEEIFSLNLSGQNEEVIDLSELKLKIAFFDLNDQNLEILKRSFPVLTPKPLGLATTFGFGDRLGIANPAHIRIIKKYKPILPVLAQQSMREIKSTNRRFKDVINSAAWSVFQEGYDNFWGADADHLKSKEDFDIALDEEFTMFTLDTSNFLGNSITKSNNILDSEKFNVNSVDLNKIRNKYINKNHKIGNHKLDFSEDNLTRIILTYENALNFTEEMFNIISSKKKDFDYEVSFDETNKTTSPEEHFYIASELKNRNVKYTSLALKFPGIFEKGVDYQGDISEFEKNIIIHGEIARYIGDYKLSLHSGSDKFSIYPFFYENTKGIFHIKTAGTSWLEAVRTIAFCDPDLFREVLKIAIETFEENTKLYEISLDYKDIPRDIDVFDDKELQALVDHRDFRRVLHIAYGAIFRKRKDELFNVLFKNEDMHYEFIIKHFEKHFKALGYRV
jgi:hypothetical protein